VSGGISQITIPVQYQEMVSFSWAGYDASFDRPTNPVGITNAQFDVKLGMVPVSFLGMEAAVSAQHTVVPLMKARMAGVKRVSMTVMSQAIFNNDYTTGIYGGAAKDQIVGGLPMALDAGASAVAYGGITRASGVATWWEGQKYATGVAVNSNARANLAQMLVKATHYAGGETPNVIFLSAQDWAIAAGDWIGTESRQLVPGASFAGDIANAGFTALSVCGVPIFYDPFIPVGKAYMVNTKYVKLYVHDDLAFTFTGFYSMVPNGQVGYVGVMLLGSEFVCEKPSSSLYLSNVTGGAGW
jgi:hypothetical protein